MPPISTSGVETATRNAEPAPRPRTNSRLGAARAARMNRERSRRVWRFFARAGAEIIWWDIVLNRAGLRRFRTPPLPRWGLLARRFRTFAVEMGGVMIKLGQFLAARVDLLPPEITGELSGLQDAVPPAPTEAVIAQIEEDFGRPIQEVFPIFDPVPMGAASLAQAHAAELPHGEKVVVKVLRPGISEIVETDLAVIGKFLRRLKRFKAVRRQMDVEWLLRELNTVTRRELDCQAEGRNAERFARDFADDPQIRVPKIYWNFTTVRELTMENVAYIPIDDFHGIRDAGIPIEQVAGKLFDCYLEQILLKHFVHADPHAGNLFVKPLPHPGEKRGEFRPGEQVPYHPDRGFQLVFVDFGMALQIPKRLRAALRDYVIGVVTRDAQMIVQSYLEAGVLLPDADVRLVEDMTAALLERFAGSFLAQMKDVDLVDYATLLAEYEELLYEAPFQFQADLLFVFRALGILSGMVSRLDPQLSPLARATPLALRLIQKDYQPSAESLLKNTVDLLRLPSGLMDLLVRIQRGNYVSQTDLTPASLKKIETLARSVTRLAWLVTGVGLLLAGSVWLSGSPEIRFRSAAGLAGFVLMAAGVAAALWGAWRGGDA
ncbi:MAG TPA: AarF/UbiB family protein [Bryobacteraceae bacterium]|nr:AarF/UbiB family protein [Bryobacteraceae bacterium]